MAGPRLGLFVGVLAALLVGFFYSDAANGLDLPNTVKGWWESFWPKIATPSEPETVITTKKKSIIDGDAKDISHLHASFPELHVPCGFIVATSLYEEDPTALHDATVHPLDTIVDPTQARSTITKDVVRADRYLTILYEEGGDNRFLPAEGLWLRMGSLDATVRSPTLVVVEEDAAGSKSKYKIRLGRDFLEANKAKIDMDLMEMYVAVHDKPNVMIPFLQTRAPLDIGQDEL